LKTIFAKNSREFRTWLQKNHKKETEVLLIFYKTNSGKPSITWPESVDEALCFGWIDGVRKGIDEISYSIRFTPRKPKSIWSLINKNKVQKLIEEGRMTAEGLKTIEHAKVSGNWDTAYSMKAAQALPPDLKKALQKNKKAWAHFNTLSNSDQFTFIWQINKVKSKEKINERIQIVVALCEKKIKPYVNGKSAITDYKNILGSDLV
jgi:uncharacterized protein YdeI (YjbR/CyaY-like superfamily)